MLRGNLSLVLRMHLLMTLQVFTRKIPFYQYTNDHMLTLGLLQRQEIPIRPIPENECDKIDDYMWDILRNCWDYIPSKRPTIEEIRRAITDLQVPEDRPKGIAQVEDNYTFWEAMRTQSGYDVDYQRVHDILLKVCNIFASSAAETLIQTNQFTASVSFVNGWKLNNASLV